MAHAQEVKLPPASTSCFLPSLIGRAWKRPSPLVLPLFRSSLSPPLPRSLPRLPTRPWKRRREPPRCPTPLAFPCCVEAPPLSPTPSAPSQSTPEAPNCRPQHLLPPRLPEIPLAAPTAPVLLRARRQHHRDRREPHFPSPNPVVPFDL